MSELYHHGIKGQKWGERNGPPYPLGSGDHSAAEKKAASGHGNKGSDSTSEKKKKKGLTDKQKTAIKVGAGIAAGALAAYGTYRLVKSGKIGKLVKKGKELLNSDGMDDVKSKTKEYMFRSPLEESNSVNPHYLEGPEWQSNCVLSSMAYCFRREGYEIQPGPSSHGFYQDEINAMFKDIPEDAKMVVDYVNAGFDRNKLKLNPAERALSKTNVMSKYRVLSKKLTDASSARGESVVNEVERLIGSKYPPGSRGIFNLDTLFGGHEMSWEVMPNGKVVILNPQYQELFTNKALYKKSMDLWFGTTRNNKKNPVTIIRTNDLELSSFGKSLMRTESGEKLRLSLGEKATAVVNNVLNNPDVYNSPTATSLKVGGAMSVYETYKIKKKKAKKAKEEEEKKKKAGKK